MINSNKSYCFPTKEFLEEVNIFAKEVGFKAKFYENSLWPLVFWYDPYVSIDGETLYAWTYQNNDDSGYLFENTDAFSAILNSVLPSGEKTIDIYPELFI